MAQRRQPWHDRQIHWILNGKVPEPCGDLLRWARSLETDRHVASTHIGDIWVSTVFLGLDHNFSDHGAPLLFETMVFEPPRTEEMFGREHTYRPESDLGRQARYSTWDDAERGHAWICKMVERSLKQGEALTNEALRKMMESDPDRPAEGTNGC